MKRHTVPSPNGHETRSAEERPDAGLSRRTLLAGLPLALAGCTATSMPAPVPAANATTME
jgi:hypothetical protein